MRKAVTGLLTLFLLIGGASAWTFTASIDTNFQDFYSQAWGIDGDVGEAIKCNALTAYAVPACEKPVKVDLGGATTTEVKWSIANSASAISDKREQVLGSTNKRLNASYGVAMAEAKAEGIEDLNAGVAEGTATQNASDVVRDWYSEIQRNSLNTRNRDFLRINASIAEANKTSGLAVSDVFKVRMADLKEEGTETPYTGTVMKSTGDIRVREYTKTLFNGETTTMYKLQANVKTVDKQQGVNSPCSSDVYHWKNLTESFTVKTYDYDGSVGSCIEQGTVTLHPKVSVTSPEGNNITYYLEKPYTETLTGIESTKDRALSNVRTIVDDIFQTYQRGEVEVSESLGPLEVLKTASTSYASTGTYDYATATARQMGLETNDTYAFRLQWSPEGVNETYKDTGQLFLDETAFNGTIETGKQYEVTDQVVWFTRTDSTGQIVQEDLNGTFTPLEITNKQTGEKVNKTTTQNVEAYESNITDLEKQFAELREEVEENQFEGSGGTAGGSLTGLFGLSTPELALSSTVVGLLLLMTAFIVGAIFS